MKNFITFNAYWRKGSALVFAFLSSILVTNAQIITTISGNGLSGFGGDGGPATNGRFSSGYIATDAAGNIYKADRDNNRIRIISNGHIINTFAGVGIPAFGGDGGLASVAQIDSPAYITHDSFGNFYLADQLNFRIRKIDLSGIITTIAGNGIRAYTGDGGPASAAQVSFIYTMTTDGLGNLYFQDHWNIRKIDAAGMISTIAGNSTFGFSGDGGPATNAAIRISNGMTTDNYGNLYISDAQNQRIRKIDVFGIISTVAGSGAPYPGTGGFAGDGGPATAAILKSPVFPMCDKDNNLYISDAGNYRIRKVSPSGIITTVAGTGTAGSTGDGGPATAAHIYAGALAVDCSGNVILDESYRLRIINFGHSPIFTGGHTQTFTVCQNAIAASINALMAVVTPDTGNTQTWSVITAPAHGSLTAAYSAVATGAVITPVGLSYTPATGYLGSDTFRVQVFDCGYIRDSTTVYISVITPPVAGSVTGADTICVGASNIFSDTATGGTWSSANTTATVSGGIVVGVAPGIDTISYTVSNTCGSNIARKIVHVRICPLKTPPLVPLADRLHVWPTQNSGLFSVSLSSSTTTHARIIITNVLGQTVKEIDIPANKENNLHLDAPLGLYFISAITPNGRLTARVVIN